MTRNPCRARTPTDRVPRGLSLVEIVVCTFLVGVLLVAALRTVGSAASGQFRNGESGRARLLARGLLAEILVLSYEEPDGTPVLGPESGEEASGTRADFDDVDDYHGWTAAPPVEKDGSALPNLTAWQRSVTVDYVDPEDLTTAVGGDQGVKRITVTVTRGGTDLASLTTVVADVRQESP